jgi:hypothetical protein
MGATFFRAQSRTRSSYAEMQQRLEETLQSRAQSRTRLSYAEMQQRLEETQIRNAVWGIQNIIFQSVLNGRALKKSVIIQTRALKLRNAPPKHDTIIVQFARY